MEVKQKSLYKNTMFKTLLNMFNLVIPLLTGPYVMRVLSKEQVGSLNFVQSIFSYFFIFATFGVAQYGIREISRCANDKGKLEKIFSNLFLITLITNAVAFFLYFLFTFATVKDQNMLFICQIFNIYFFFNVFEIEWMNIALENFGFITIKTIIVKTLYVICIFVFVKSADDFKNYIFLIVATTCIGNVLSFTYIKRTFKFSFKEFDIKSHIKPMFLMVIISNTNVLYTQLDRYMIGEVLGGAILSYYAVAQGIISIINTLMMSVIQACIPRLNSYVNSSKEAYINLLYKVSNGYFMLMFPASVGIFLISENLIVLYGGAQYKGAGIVLSCFAVYMITIAFDNILGNQIMYINKCEKKQVSYIFMGGVLNLVLNYLLIKFKIFSPSTAVITTGIANILVVILQHRYVKNVLKIEYNVFSAKNLKYLAISLVFVPIIFLIKKLELGILMESFWAVSISGLTYFAILFLIKDTMFLTFSNKILGMVKRR